MELDEFVTETLNQIIKGVKEAQAINKDNINPNVTYMPVVETNSDGNMIHNINFDVAVTASDGDSSKAKIGVVSGIFNAGAEGQTETKNSSVTRIKFSVPITYPK